MLVLPETPGNSLGFNSCLYFIFFFIFTPVEQGWTFGRPPIINSRLNKNMSLSTASEESALKFSKSESETEGEREAESGATQCATCRWRVRNVLVLHHCLELATPHWNISSGTTPHIPSSTIPINPPMSFFHRGCLS